jgi:hydrophobe/amphiphile efflux-1 (HAE1) family protein
MAARQITVLDVQSALREQNVELPSGRLENVEREMTILTLGELKTAEEFNNLVVRRDGSRLVYLKDIGKASEGVENERTRARTFGKPCVFLGIVKQSKANTVEVAEGIKRRIQEIRPTLPPSVEMMVNHDESVFVKNAIHEVWGTLLVAFLLVVLVIFVFLRNLRSTLIPAVAIPVSIIGTFAVLYWLGYSVNILTLLAFVLAIGVVVDDAIVVLENIYRHIEQGVPPMEAAFKGMREIGFAILAITFSLVAIFLPLAFQKSTTGRLFVEFAVAVSGAVIISAFVALSLSPMMAARLLKPHTRRPGKLYMALERGFEGITEAYRKTLVWALARRALILTVTAISFVLMVVSYLALEKEFLPDEDKGRLLAIVVAPEGSTVEYTDQIMRKTEEILRSVPEVESYGTIVAPGFSGPGQANSGIAFVRFKTDRKKSVQELVNGPGGLRARFFAEVPGAIVIPQIPKTITRSFFSAPLQVVVQSDNLDELNKFGVDFVNRLRKEPYLQNVRSTFEINKPELRVSIDRARAAALGVSVEDISRTLQILFGGLDLSAIKFRGKEYEVIAQLERTSRMIPQDLDKLYVRNNKGDLVQLSSLVSKEVSPAPNTIEHYSRLRSTTISATPIGIPLGTAMERLEGLLRQDMPPGFSFEWAGEGRDLREAGQEVWWVFALALIIVYMVLAAQFESLVHPFTVMLAVPLGAVGAFGLLWLLSFGNKLGLWPAIPAMNINLFSQIGLILLVGLVTKNSILLVEYANQAISEGKAPDKAMLEAGLIRLRPILMTAFSTIAGILPIAIGVGAGAESRRPLGVAVVGGMITSTFLTLYVVPVVYLAIQAVASRVSRRFSAAPAAPNPGGEERSTANS